MSRQKQKGTSFETAVLRYLRHVLDDTENTIRREAQHGKHDLGDIAGLRIHGQPAALEAKNYKTYSGYLKQWMREARTEAGNADAPYWFVVFHQRGVGLDSLQSLGRQPVVTDLRTLALIAGHGVINEEEEGDEE